MDNLLPSLVKRWEPECDALFFELTFTYIFGCCLLGMIEAIFQKTLPGEGVAKFAGGSCQDDALRRPVSQGGTACLLSR
jgi:hypothetical protein